MVVFYADGHRRRRQGPVHASRSTGTAWSRTGTSPRTTTTAASPTPACPTRATCSTARAPTNVDIRGYVYGRGDLSSTGVGGRPPVVRAGQSLTFTNLDATQTMTPQASAYHTITACKAPCDRTTGIAYPLANADVQFDSGELGYGPSLPIPGFGGKFTPAANRNTWKTPKTLKAGHLHLLLPDPPVHARRVPGGGQGRQGQRDQEGEGQVIGIGAGGAYGRRAPPPPAGVQPIAGATCSATLPSTCRL